MPVLIVMASVVGGDRVDGLERARGDDRGEIVAVRLAAPSELAFEAGTNGEGLEPPGPIWLLVFSRFTAKTFAMVNTSPAFRRQPQRRSSHR